MPKNNRAEEIASSRNDAMPADQPSKLGATVQPRAEIALSWPVVKGEKRSQEHTNTETRLPAGGIRLAHRARPGGHGGARVRCTRPLDSGQCAVFLGLR